MKIAKCIRLTGLVSFSCLGLFLPTAQADPQVTLIGQLPSQPGGVAVSPSNQVFVSDGPNGTVYQYNPTTAAISSFYQFTDGVSLLG